MSLIKRGASPCFNLLVSFAIFLAAIPLRAQDKKDARQSPDDQEVIKVNSNLVSVDVVVKDKKGKVVTDLKAADFTITENGVPQHVEFFDSTLTSENRAGQPATTIGSTQPKPENPSGLPVRLAR